jgi:porphobilinogen synthase
MRDTVAETSVRHAHLMQPLFVAESPKPGDIPGMPGVAQLGVDGLVREISQLVELGQKSFILFGVPDKKDARAAGAHDPQGIVPRALRAVRSAVGKEAYLATDVCLCSYTDTGHCGVMAGERIDNDASIDILGKVAVAHVEAGADMVAPSDMMDFRVGAIRRALDAAGKPYVPIMSYAVKYASSLYGPFRAAADSAPKLGDRKGYQMDVRNRREALREALLDADEGADMLMVKPGLAYLDILRDLREATELPLAAYQVSGEYAMIRYAAQAGALDERAVVRELWLAFRRAGASLILTYHAAIAAREKWLEG